MSNHLPEARYLMEESLLGVLFHDIHGAAGVGIMGSSIISDLAEELLTKEATGALDPKDLQQSLREILEASKSIETTMNTLVEELEQSRQALSQLSSTEVGSQNITEVWRRVISGFRSELSEKHLEVQVRVDPSLELSLRQGILDAIFFELISNSLSHGYTRGRSCDLILEAHLVSETNSLRLLWSDTGTGAEFQNLKSQIARVRFDRGLGLPLVHRLVTRYLQGRMNISTAPEQGFRVEIIIPLTN